ncbi:MAG: hypothetical protein AAFO15_02620, partial [Pseudomonadota bacterium]
NQQNQGKFQPNQQNQGKFQPNQQNQGKFQPNQQNQGNFSQRSLSFTDQQIQNSNLFMQLQIQEGNSKSNKQNMKDWLPSFKRNLEKKNNIDRVNNYFSKDVFTKQLIMIPQQTAFTQVSRKEYTFEDVLKMVKEGVACFNYYSAGFRFSAYEFPRDSSFVPKIQKDLINSLKSPNKQKAWKEIKKHLNGNVKRQFDFELAKGIFAILQSNLPGWNKFSSDQLPKLFPSNGILKSYHENLAKEFENGNPKAVVAQLISSFYSFVASAKGACLSVLKDGDSSNDEQQLKSILFQYIASFVGNVSVNMSQNGEQRHDIDDIFALEPVQETIKKYNDNELFVKLIDNESLQQVNPLKQIVKSAFGHKMNNTEFYQSNSKQCDKMILLGYMSFTDIFQLETFKGVQNQCTEGFWSRFGNGVNNGEKIIEEGKKLIEVGANFGKEVDRNPAGAVKDVTKVFNEAEDGIEAIFSCLRNKTYDESDKDTINMVPQKLLQQIEEMSKELFPTLNGQEFKLSEKASPQALQLLAGKLLGEVNSVLITIDREVPEPGKIGEFDDIDFLMQGEGALIANGSNNNEFSNQSTEYCDFLS